MQLSVSINNTSNYDVHSKMTNVVSVWALYTVMGRIRGKDKILGMKRLGMKRLSMKVQQ